MYVCMLPVVMNNNKTHRSEFVVAVLSVDTISDARNYAESSLGLELKMEKAAT